MLPLSRIVSQRSPWQMYTLATRSTRFFGVGHVSFCTGIKLIADLTRFTGDNYTVKPPTGQKKVVVLLGWAYHWGVFNKNVWIGHFAVPKRWSL